MTTDNRPNEPTESRVEAAANALRADEGFMAGVHRALEVSWSEYIARLVLVAAQEAAPQAEVHEPSHDRVYCVRCGGNWPCQGVLVVRREGSSQDWDEVVDLAEDPDSNKGTK